MLKRHHLIVALASALLSHAVMAQDDVQKSLIERGQFWQSRDDFKRATEVWNKLLEISPDNPNALYGLGSIALKEGNMTAAQSYLQRLQASHANDPNTLLLDQKIRLSTSENKALLEQIRQHISNTEYDLALQKYEQLFKGHVPMGPEAQMYYTLLGYKPQGTSTALENLKRLKQYSPQDTSIDLSIARLTALQESTRFEGIKQLARLSKDSEIGSDAAESWRDALTWSGPPVTPESRQIFEQYLQEFPDDTEIRNLLEEGRTLATRAPRTIAAAPPDPLRKRTDEAMKLLEAGDVYKATREFEEVLAKRPSDSEALGGLGVIAMREGKWQEALDYLTRARRGNPAWQSSLNTARYWVEIDKARAALQAGNVKQARTIATQASRMMPREQAAHVLLADIMLEQGYTQNAITAYSNVLKQQPENVQALLGLGRALRQIGRPEEASQLLDQAAARKSDDPWVSYELAMAYREQGNNAKANQILQKISEQFPGNPEAFHVQALAAVSDKQWDKAISLLDKVPETQRTGPMLQLYANANAQKQIAEAVGLAKAGNKQYALEWLEQIEVKSRDNTPLLLSLAQAYTDIGQTGRAMSIVESIRSKGGNTAIDADISKAGILLAEGKDAEALRLLKQLQSSSTLTQAQHERVTSVADGFRIRQAEDLLAKGKLAQAYETLDPVLKRDPDNIAANSTLARMYAADGQYDKAIEIYKRLIAENPDNPQLHLGLALISQQTGNTGKALQEAQRAVDLSEQNPDVLIAAARLARDSGNTGDAVKLLEQALEHSRTESTAPTPASSSNPFVRTEVATTTPSSDLEKELEALYEQRSAKVTGGAFVRYRDGDPGTSQLTEFQAPIEASIPAGNGVMLVRATPTYIDAGSTNYPPYVGPEQLAPYSLQNVTGQSQSGVALSLGYRYRGMEFDVGVTPVGFQQTNFTAGALFSGQFGSDGSLNYRLDLSRRPVTDSVLSYAGMRYDNLGLSWGGVMATGARATLVKDFGKAGVYGSLSWHYLNGKNVESNQRTEISGGAYAHVINEQDRRLTVGLHASATFFKNNLGAFSYGSGGYFSPQRHLALAFPISWAQRSGSWSYRIDTALGWQSIRQDSAPVFPNNPDLQALATQFGGPSNTFGYGYYPEQTKTGLSYNLRAAAEYRFNPNLVAGATISTNNAEDYREWIGGVYLRYFFHPQSSTSLDLSFEPYRPTYSNTYGR